MADEKKKYVYERNPDTGEVRRRELLNYENVETIIPARSPDAPWIDNKQLLNEKKDDEDDRQLSLPFE
tara:strand:+ start:1121 stop:1324 length:204 start_codon:yes stop_codon:yes gene_type:complete